MSVIVRRMLEPDIPAVKRMFEALDIFHYALDSKRYQDPKDIKYLPANFNWYLRYGADHGLMLVANESRKFVGMLEARIDRFSGPHRQGEFIHVFRVWVEPSHRQRGIGSLLVSGLKEWMAVKCITQVELNVHAKNTGAIALYEKNGFSAISQRMSLSI